MNYIESSVETILMIHKYEDLGDILIFQADRQAVELVTSVINNNRDKTLYAIPLFTGLSMNEQLKAIDRPPHGHRKVVVATSIAEASVTIDGIVFGIILCFLHLVIDPGTYVVKVFNPKSGLESIVTSTISKASAIQRAGRAGRTRPGKCFRLFTEDSYDALSDNSVPAIKRSNLAGAVLHMKALGIENVLRFDYLSPPPSAIVSLVFNNLLVDALFRVTLFSPGS
jgi:ATP-dependent RNA helicase DDX35